MCKLSDNIEMEVQKFKSVQKREREIQRLDSVRRILESKRGCTEVLNSVRVKYMKHRLV
jgi:hypothetical protein